MFCHQDKNKKKVIRIMYIYTYYCKTEIQKFCLFIDIKNVNLTKRKVVYQVQLQILLQLTQLLKRKKFGYLLSYY